ncbi:monofunctional biosynthetic peptidoglycan transglycosylase [Falsirhodobacter sp. 1013]|uniref:monofunctional biosynthetic peptidoglycan transglycosylase n=1 Tax=Falsirhodobacter sp. 1013 TaxID=3417566 RepID=UPI003EB84BC6
MAKKRSLSRSRFNALPKLRPWIRRIGLGILAALGLLIVIYSVVTPPITPYMLAERARLGEISHQTVDMDDIAPVMARSVVAAEDANFCRHWGFDMRAIRSAVAEGSNRGASTLSQQVAKNVFLWQGRSWVRKALEAVLTPAVELVWTKRHLLEVYLNVAEFGEGIFGVQAAAQHYFRVDAADLSPSQAARLAAILPDPKRRDPIRPTKFVDGRARAAASGAATIRADGRSQCFEG